MKTKTKRTQLDNSNVSSLLRKVIEFCIRVFYAEKTEIVSPKSK